MIVKENTHLGEKFLNACFKSLHEGYYPNEIILIDNGSSDFILDLQNQWKKDLKDDLDCNVKIINSDLKDFTSLRNLCIEHTSPTTDFMHWIDSDEVYYPQDLDRLKNYIMPANPHASEIWTLFYHFMINPFMIQDKCSKDNIFGFHKGLKWQGKTHEKLHNKKQGSIVGNSATRVEYLHYGYIRHQWRTCLKWLHYDYIQHGHVNGYKLENLEENSKTVQKDWFRDWRDPNHVVHDRRRCCSLFPNGKEEITVKLLQDGKLKPLHYYCKTDLPDAALELMNGCKNEQQWIAYIDSLDGNDFWEQWQDKKNEVGSWRETLDWVVDEMNKIDWKMI